MKRLICAGDIEALSNEGKKVCVVGPQTIVTPAARDAADTFGITFCDEEPKAEPVKASNALPCLKTVQTAPALRSQTLCVILTH